ncbi:MAG TPA: 1,4-dihydroxy-2-naphthoate polyprenyltransferase [Rhodothermales bacterium]|nr:1,4-dihydroxy-2-naphthoate polyprenyltransferase [Rhodothermales bacterium]
MDTPAQPRSRLKVWLLAARPKTLWAAVAPVVVGTALAVDDGVFHALSAFFALLGSVLIQVGTNFSNDYADFEKGADTGERKGPMRVTQAGLVTPEMMRRATSAVFALALLSGVYLIWRGGWPVVAIGVLSILSGILYTAGRYSLAYLGLGDLFVLIFFGPVAVAGTYYVQALFVQPFVLVAGLGPGLLSVAILLANNIRDVDEDRLADKRTLVVRFGRSFGVGLYGFCLGGAAVVALAVAFLSSQHPWAAVAALVPVLGIVNVKTLAREREAHVLNPVLGATGRLLFIYSFVFSVGWIL